MDQVIGCRDAVERLWDFLDHELDDADKGTVEAHLAFCRQCCGELEFARHLRTLLATKGAGEPPGSVRVRLERFIDELTGPAGLEGAP
jgi:mycothiol system anti-sigma-R factor